MPHDTILLMITAASLGFFHTLLGPDHYLPFIAMAKARNWSAVKTILITVVCGFGHILSSVVLGIIGIGFGLLVNKLELFESFRGDLAAWFLISFGLIYFIWGARKAFKSHGHSHNHFLGAHQSKTETLETSVKKGDITPWILFTIFVLGPCEPLIPILMYPAAQNSTFTIILVTFIFGAVTILTMLGLVMTSYFGLSFLSLKNTERYIHAIAGGTICLCGMAIQFLGL